MSLPYYRIRHSIPGRMRVKSFLMKENPDRCTTVSNALKEMRGIVAVTSNPVVGSAVIQYDEKKITQEAVLAKLDELFPARYHLKREASVKAVVAISTPKPRSLLRDLVEVSALAVIVVCFLIKSFFGKTPVNETVFG
ncbi:MAG: hypothetical protein KAI50_12910, partial [Desulfobacterales bacterium]|nr:hypothetical protein [Desulfobacterales bacterium]